ncbi:iron chaperone [Streptomyces sp. NPDC054956]
MTNTQKPAKKTAAAGKASERFTEEERAAMKDHAQELRASARRGSRADKAAAEEADVVAKIAEMQDSDRIMAERIHAIVKENAPELAPKLWYGMPSYARDGKVVCFFQSAEKFKARYATLGFSDQAHLDEGSMWATSYALTRLTAADEARIAELVKSASN